MAARGLPTSDRSVARIAAGLPRRFPETSLDACSGSHTRAGHASRQLHLERPAAGARRLASLRAQEAAPTGMVETHGRGLACSEALYTSIAPTPTASARWRSFAACSRR